MQKQGKMEEPILREYLKEKSGAKYEHVDLELARMDIRATYREKRTWRFFLWWLGILLEPFTAPILNPIVLKYVYYHGWFRGKMNWSISGWRYGYYPELSKSYIRGWFKGQGFHHKDATHRFD